MNQALAIFDKFKANVVMFVSPVKTITVTDGATDAIAMGTLKTIADLEKQIEAQRVALVKPLNDEVDRINAYAKEIKGPLLEAKAFVKTKREEFADIERKKADEERKRIEAKRQEDERRLELERRKREADAQAQRDAAEKVRLANEKAQRAALLKQQKEEAEARKMFGVDDESEAQKRKDEAEALKKKQMEDRLAANVAAETARVEAEAKADREAAEAEAKRRADLAALDASRVKNVKQVPVYEIIDIEELPGKYWMVDEVALARDVKAGVRDIPGVKIEMRTAAIAR